MSLVRLPQPSIWDHLSRILEGVVSGLEVRRQMEERQGAIWENLANQAADIAVQSGQPEEEAIRRAKEYAEQIARERGLQLPADFEQRIRARFKAAPRPAVRSEVLQAVQSAIRAVRQKVSAGQVGGDPVDAVVKTAEDILRATGVPVPPNLRELAAAYWGVESGVEEKKVSQWFPEDANPWMKAVPQHVKDMRVASEEEAWKVVGPWMDRIAEVLQRKIQEGTATPDEVGIYAELRKRLGVLYPAPKTEEVKVETRTESPLTPETPAARVAREYGAPRTYTTTTTESFQVTGLEGQKRETLEEVLVRTKREDLIPVIRAYNPNLLRVPLANDAIRQRVEEEIRKAVESYQRRPMTLAEVVRGILAGTIPSSESDRRAAEALLGYAATGRANLNIPTTRGEALAQVRSLSAVLSASEKAAGRAQRTSDAFRSYVMANRETFTRMMGVPGREAVVRDLILREARRLGVEDPSLIDWAWKYISAYRAGVTAEKATRESEARSRKAEDAEVRLADALIKVSTVPSNFVAILSQKVDEEMSRVQSRQVTGRTEEERRKSEERKTAQLSQLREIQERVRQGKYSEALNLIKQYARTYGGMGGALGTGFTQEFLRNAQSSVDAYNRALSETSNRLTNYLRTVHGFSPGEAARHARKISVLLLTSPEELEARLYDEQRKVKPDAVRTLEEMLNVVLQAVPGLPGMYPSWWEAVQQIIQRAKSGGR